MSERGALGPEILPNETPGYSANISQPSGPGSSLTSIGATANGHAPACSVKCSSSTRVIISDKWEHYPSIYESVLSGFIARGQPIRLLEIGVQNGG
jgi:hypothetical protein